jgi:cation transport regulator ChaC
MAADERHYVFGYGSLTQVAGSRRAQLRGYRRAWGVAMDNAVDLAGYKCYLRPDGSRPAVLVAFLDVLHAPGASVSGVCFPVEHAALAALDARERNYERVDVTAHIDPAPGRTWTYIGSREGRARFARGSEEGRVVISGEYLQRVEDGLRTLGDGVGSVAPGGLPVWELRRVELPP